MAGHDASIGEMKERQIEEMEARLEHARFVYDKVKALQQSMFPRSAEDVHDSKRKKQLKVVEMLRCASTACL
jgi:hypothetical protein